MKKLLFILILPLILFLVSCGGEDGELTPILIDPTDSLHTWIPDDNFEQHLVNQGIDDVLDNQILTSKIDTLKGLNLSDMILMGIPKISDLTGIQDFVSLEYLNVLDNPIEKINIENLFFLRTLLIPTSRIDTLVLPISNNFKGGIFEGNGTCYVDFRSNNSYTSLTLMNINFDINFDDCIYLKNLKIYNNDLNSLDLENNVALEYLDLKYLQNLQNLKIGDNTNLNTLILLGMNSLYSLDLSGITNLKNLELSSTQLSDINLLNNNSLESFSCVDNPITSLDLTKCNLLAIYCRANDQLVDVDLRNNNNSLILSPNFTMYANYNLYCVNVDNVSYSTNTWTNISNQIYFSEDCP